jgi:hypothetical protein
VRNEYLRGLDASRRSQASDIWQARADEVIEYTFRTAAIGGADMT